MIFSIITPSFNSLSYLKSCCASIADQQHVKVQHLVMDAGSTDGTVEWLQHQKVDYVSERDRGMYDALNKGWSRSTGDILAWLNCDEQYLPGTLARVEDAFARHPEVDLIFGDALVIDPAGQLLCYRKHAPLRACWVMAARHLYILSCALFMRRRFFDEGFRFNIDYRIVGDHELILRLLRAGYTARHLPGFLATFAVDGENLSTTPRALAESAQLGRATPRWVRALRLPLNASRLVLKAARGSYRAPDPLRYSIFADRIDRRTEFAASRPTWRWPATRPRPNNP